jgi:hypothetical protein
VDVVASFLQRTLRGGFPRVQTRTERFTGWEDVNDRVAPSVVMIVRSLSAQNPLDAGAIAQREAAGTSSDADARPAPRASQPSPQATETSPRAGRGSPQPNPAPPSPQPSQTSPPPNPAAPAPPHWLIPPEPGGPEGFAPEGSLATLDLGEHFNAQLDQSTSDRPGNHWRELPRGEQTFAGVPFRVGEGMVQLRGGQRWQEFPERVEISAGTYFSNLYLLHATQVNLPAPIPVGAVRFRYRDGTSATHAIEYKRHVADGWLRWEPQPLPEAAFGWVGDNPAAGAAGYRLSLYVTRFRNPHPEKEVEAIVYESTSNPVCAPFCVAMTIEQPTGSAPAVGLKDGPTVR